jgi:hypothetical protein
MDIKRFGARRSGGGVMQTVAAVVLLLVCVVAVLPPFPPQARERFFAAAESASVHDSKWNLSGDYLTSPVCRIGYADATAPGEAYTFRRFNAMGRSDVPDECVLLGGGSGFHDTDADCDSMTVLKRELELQKLTRKGVLTQANTLPEDQREPLPQSLVDVVRDDGSLLGVRTAMDRRRTVRACKLQFSGEPRLTKQQLADLDLVLFQAMVENDRAVKAVKATLTAKRAQIKQFEELCRNEQDAIKAENDRKKAAADAAERDQESCRSSRNTALSASMTADANLAECERKQPADCIRSERCNSVSSGISAPVSDLGPPGMVPWRVSGFPDPDARWIWYHDQGAIYAGYGRVVFQYIYGGSVDRMTPVVLNVMADGLATVWHNGYNIGAANSGSWSNITATLEPDTTNVFTFKVSVNKPLVYEEKLYGGLLVSVRRVWDNQVVFRSNASSGWTTGQDQNEDFPAVRDARTPCSFTYDYDKDTIKCDIAGNTITGKLRVIQGPSGGGAKCPEQQKVTDCASTEYSTTCAEKCKPVDCKWAWTAAEMDCFGGYIRKKKAVVTQKALLGGKECQLPPDQYLVPCGGKWDVDWDLCWNSCQHPSATRTDPQSGAQYMIMYPDIATWSSSQSLPPWYHYFGNMYGGVPHYITTPAGWNEHRWWPRGKL